MLFTDYYAEASCTAGRANFITGQLPIRTGMTTVGQAGGATALPARRRTTIATALKSPWATPPANSARTISATEQVPADRARLRRVLRLSLSPRRDVGSVLVRLSAGLRSTGTVRAIMVRSVATTTDDATVDPRWGKVGKQTDRRRRHAGEFRVERADHQGWQKAVPPNTTWRPSTTSWSITARASWTRPRRTASRSSSGTTRRACTSVTFCRRNTARCRTRQTNYGLEEAGMTQLDDSIGALLKHLDDIGEADNTIVDLHHRQRRRSLHLAGRRHDAVQGHQGHRLRRRLPRAVHRPLAGQDQAGHGRERHLLRPRLVPDLAARPRAIRTSPTSCSRA